LQKITPALRAHPAVLEVRAEIYAKAGKWSPASSLARHFIQIFPKEARFCVSHVVCHRANGGRWNPSGKPVTPMNRGELPELYHIDKERNNIKKPLYISNQFIRAFLSFLARDETRNWWSIYMVSDFDETMASGDGGGAQHIERQDLNAHQWDARPI
jgi:hypothetical protein